MDQAQFLSLNEALNFEVIPFWDGQPDDFGVHFSSETELGPDQTMTVKVSVYDEGKAEGGESYYEVKDGMVRAIGNSGSGPWASRPDPRRSSCRSPTSPPRSRRRPTAGRNTGSSRVPTSNNWTQFRS